MKKTRDFKTVKRELKTEIMVKAGYQIFLKNQRKTVKLVGKREIPADEAVYKHRNNRLELRAMYMAYATLRGRDKIDSIDSRKFENDWDMNHFNKRVEELVKEYTPEVVEETAE